MYITIVDFSDGKIYQYSAHNLRHSEELEDFILAAGFNLKEIEWMYHSDNKIY